MQQVLIDSNFNAWLFFKSCNIISSVRLSVCMPHPVTSKRKVVEVKVTPLDSASLAQHFLKKESNSQTRRENRNLNYRCLQLSTAMYNDEIYTNIHAFTSSVLDSFVYIVDLLSEIVFSGFIRISYLHHSSCFIGFV